MSDKTALFPHGFHAGTKPGTVVEVGPDFDPLIDSPHIAEPIAEEPHRGSVVNPKQALALMSGKLPLSTVPMTMVSMAAVQLHNGSGKYGRHNYRGTGVLFSTYYEAIMRHTMALWDGEEFDEEGVHNLCGLSANVAILTDAFAHGYLIDDRPPAVNQRALWDSFKPVLAANVERNKEKSPRHYTNQDEVFKA